MRVTTTIHACQENSRPLYNNIAKFMSKFVKTTKFYKKT